MSITPGLHADRCNVLADLGAGQLAALAGLGALRDLDLDLLSRHQVGWRDTEAARGDLLDLGEREVAVLDALEVGEGGGVALAVGIRDGHPAGLVLAALARVGAAARAVDAHRERLVRLTRERAERHAASGEALHDLLGWLHFVEGDRLAVGDDLEHVADGGRGRVAHLLLEDLVHVEALAVGDLLGLARLLEGGVEEA